MEPLRQNDNAVVYEAGGATWGAVARSPTGHALSRLDREAGIDAFDGHGGEENASV